MLIKFFKYFNKNRNSFIKYSLLSLLAGITELFGVALTYPFVVKLLSREDNKSTVLVGLSIVLLFIAKNVFMIFYTHLQAKLTNNIEAEINLSFMKYFINAPYNETIKIPFSRKNNIFNFLVPNVINNFILRLLNLSVNLFIFTLISILIAVKFPLATVATTLCAALLITIQVKIFRPRLERMSKKISLASALSIQKTNDAVLNLKSVKISHHEKFFFENYKSAIENFYKLKSKSYFYNAIPPYVTEPFIIILLFILLAIVSIQNFSEPDRLVACFAMIAAAIFRLAPAISRIQVNLNGISSALPMTKELLDVYEKFNAGEVPKPEEKPFYRLKSSIELRNADYSYDFGTYALKNINLVIQKGEFIGIAGLSGVGKSTLADIISGLTKPTRGEMLVDGNIIDLPLSVGYITQEYGLINGTIRENVAFGGVEIDDERVRDALKKAQLYDFIKDHFSDEIYANPFVDSSGFSQGQKQRLMIARALYTEPDILILDEATSSLDVKTENEICNVLLELKGSKTIIAIAHRLSAIKAADRIVYMANSSIADMASFGDLMERNGDFRELVKLSSLK